MIRLLRISLFLACFPIFLTAQENDFGNWYIYFGNKQLSDRWNWHHEVQYRNYNFIGDLEQLLLRTGIGYNLSENNHNILLGYGFIRSENYEFGSVDEKMVVNEHRIYQQFISRQKVGPVGLQHRYRFEQRFVEDNFRIRFRYFLGINIPLTKKVMGEDTFYLSAYNEVFLNGQKAVFDRNRLYGGLGYAFSKNFRVELGAMSQIFESRNRAQFQIVVFNNLPRKG